MIKPKARGGEMEQKRRSTHGLGQHHGDCEGGGEGIKGINGNEKNTIKIN